MNGAARITRMMCCIFLCGVFCVSSWDAIAVEDTDVTEPPKTEAQLKLEEKAKEDEKIKEQEEAAAKARREAAEKAKLEEEIAKLNLPEDRSPRLSVRELSISGNTLISTEELLKDVPAIYNASDKPLEEAEGGYLFDLRVLQDIIAQPGRPREVSTRTIQGFTQYVLSAYQDRNYGGIYVYVPSEALREGRKLQDEILPVRVLEASVSEVRITYYNPEGEKVEKGYLNSPVVRDWSPVKAGQVANRKELDDFVNLLNLNPDRYISAVISKGIEPNSLALEYNIYEADPWHYYIQVDNSGTENRQWAPRIGLINTNLTGMDDRLTLMAQVAAESDFDDSYSAFGSYELPLWTPKLRLNLYGGRSEFDIDAGGGISFLGHGSFYGSMLRYNVFQADGWFFDVTSSLSHEESKVSTSILATVLGSRVEMDLWGIGVNIHRLDDMSNTSLGFDQVQSIDGSSDADFAQARTGAKSDFTIYTTSAIHKQFLDPDKIQRLSGSFRWITSDERLVPAKMTTFGGMYSVRGYKESKIVADGGVLGTVQYEFDLVRYDRSKEVGEPEQAQATEELELKKLAPLVFFDYGQAKMEDPVSGEKASEDLYSVGVGTLVELGDNFSGAVFYGYPLKATDDTKEGHGRLNISLILRW